MPQSRPNACSLLQAPAARGAVSTLLWRPWRTGHGRGGLASGLALASLAALLVAGVPASARAQQKAPTRSTRAQEPEVLCDTVVPAKLVHRAPVKPRSLAAGHRRKVVHPKPVVVATKPVAAKPRPAVAAGHRRARPRVKPVVARKPNCVKAAAAVVPTPEAKQALVAALPWTAPAPAALTAPEILPFSLPGTIGGGSNAWALGLAGLSAFYFVGHDHSQAAAITPPPTVTPEPASLALLATGLVALGAGAGIKRRRSSRND